jgi:predicted RecB family nuclease
MVISSHIFDAYLNCPSKCWFRFRNEVATGNMYSQWLETHSQYYRKEALKRLLASVHRDDFIVAPSRPINIKIAKWKLAADFSVRKDNLEANVHAIERMSLQDRPDQFIPILFVFANKLTKKNKLLLAFSSLVLSEAFKHEIVYGQIIHGDDFTKTKIKMPLLIRDVQKINGKIATLLASNSPPEIILNRHCTECEFQAMCRRKAVERDNLSLLAGMNEKELKKYNGKGIFTITQLSYTFRPRRRPKRLRNKKEKYHHPLKALAIREKKIHIIGNPELKIDGTPVYLDVEGIPDRDFYYLIGLSISNDNSLIQHSLWADTPKHEETIWKNFLAILSSIEKPVVIHYGSYESGFLKRMDERYGGPAEGSASDKAIKESINLLSVIYSQIYFPGFGNGLKDIAGFLGFVWANADFFGIQSIAWRLLWEHIHNASIKDKLVRYNTQDCEALKLLTDTVQHICDKGKTDLKDRVEDANIIYLDSDRYLNKSKWQKFTSPVTSLELINSAARWSYQRDRVYARTGEVRLVKKKHRSRRNKISPPELIIKWASARTCPNCKRSYYRKCPDKSKKLYEIMFGHRSIKLRLVKYIFPTRVCRKCHTTYGMPDRYKFIKKYGWNFISYFLYHIVDLGIPQRKVVCGFNRLFNFELNRSTLHNLKIRTATYYAETKQQILERVVRGNLLHIDETRANVKGQSAFVWVLTSHKEVVYVLSESREGEIAHKLLADFKGVLISDFYTAYDSINCPQQKCLIHLMRDLNDDILSNPFDEQLKQIVVGFGDLLKPIIDTCDRYGLKKYFLKKHLVRVEQFYKNLDHTDYKSEIAIKCKERFDKNRDKLFTFLGYDGVPWNNNNAEHAIKAFARLRDVISGISTEKGIDEYLTLLSICQTCNYSGVDFLDFLRSGEKSL